MHTSPLCRTLPRVVVLVLAVLLTPLVGPRALCGQAVAQVSAGPDADPGPWVPSLRAIGQDAIHIVRAPVEWSLNDHLFAVGASGVVLGAISALDRPAYRRFSRRSGWARDVTGPMAAPGRWYDRMGPDRVALGTAGLLAATGVVFGRRDFTRTSVRVLEAVVYTKAITGFAKGVFGRTRPFVGDGPFNAELAEFEGTHTETSMPSGHTSRAFAIASVLAHEADRWYVSVLSYGGAASVGIERMRSGDHWLTDVAVGAAIGYLIGRSVVPSESSSTRVTYTPLVSADQVGLSVRF